MIALGRTAFNETKIKYLSRYEDKDILLVIEFEDGKCIYIHSPELANELWATLSGTQFEVKKGDVTWR